MEIRFATPEDKSEIIAVYQASQMATGLPGLDYAQPGELGQKLYERNALERYVAVLDGRVVGHGLIQKPNSAHLSMWRAYVPDNQPLLELGGAFVHPAYTHRGIWTALFEKRLERILQLKAVPVTGTWIQNHYIIRKFIKVGGQKVGSHKVPGGEAVFFVFL